MSRTHRLFSIMGTLRLHRRPVTADRLAEEQQVSARTIYRDIQTLIGLGAPIAGEAGVGYMLRSGFFLPPLMFTAEEIEAIVLGARWVRAQADAGLAAAAATALSKVAVASPADLRDQINDIGLWPGEWHSQESTELLLTLRESMRRETALALKYQADGGATTEREVWPIQIAYYGGKQVFVAWCCVRKAFRNFRVDRVQTLSLLQHRYGVRRAKLYKTWRDEVKLSHPDWFERT